MSFVTNYDWQRHRVGISDHMIHVSWYHYQFSQTNAICLPPVSLHSTHSRPALDIYVWVDWDQNKEIQRIKTSIMCRGRDEPSVIIRSTVPVSLLGAIYLASEHRHRDKRSPPRAKWIKFKLTSEFIKDDILNIHIIFIYCLPSRAVSPTYKS